MNILIMGAGALGSVVGGFLVKKGHPVTLLGREAHMNAIDREGLWIHGIWGDHHVSSLKTCSSSEALPSEFFDLIFITVKSYATEEAVETILPCLHPHGLVCSYQNGLGNLEYIASQAGWERSFGARVIFGARVPKAGHVEVTVMAAPTALGRYEQGPPVESIQSIADMLADAALPTVFTEELETLLWGKVAYNCALNPLSALLDVSYGALAESQHTRDIMEEVIRELYAVAQERKVPLSHDTPDSWLQHFYEVLLPPTAAHYASMREDLRLGRRTEIDALNGAIVRFGAEQGQRCFTNELLTRLIRAREEGVKA